MTNEATQANVFHGDSCGKPVPFLFAMGAFLCKCMLSGAILHDAVNNTWAESEVIKCMIFVVKKMVNKLFLVPTNASMLSWLGASFESRAHSHTLSPTEEADRPPMFQRFL